MFKYFFREFAFSYRNPPHSRPEFIEIFINFQFRDILKFTEESESENFVKKAIFTGLSGKFV